MTSVIIEPASTGAVARASAARRILFAELNTDGTVGGSHVCLLEFLRRLDRAKFEPYVLFHQDNVLIKQFADLATVLVVPRPTALSFGTPRLGPLSIAWRGAQHAANLVRLYIAPAIRGARLLRWHRIEVVHQNNSIHIGLEWLLAAKLARIKCVAHQRGFGPPRRAPLSGHYDKIVCISHQIREFLIGHNPALRSSTTVIYDGVDIDEFRSRVRPSSVHDMRKRLGVPDGAFLTGIVGNIKEWKGQHVVLKALSLLRDFRPTVHCALVGSVAPNSADTAYRDRLLAFIRAHALDDRVTLTGFRDDVADLVSAVDILIHASTRAEPFGRVILEGMSLGKPVIATDHGGPREIIEDGSSGFLVRPDDPECLAACIRRLLESADLRRRIGEQAVARVNRAFNMVDTTAEIQRLYCSLWDGSGLPVKRRQSFSPT